MSWTENVPSIEELKRFEGVTEQKEVDVTIEERATTWAIANTVGVSDECRPEMITSFKMVYETVATEQEAIIKKEMIEKAWKWIENACSKYPLTVNELPILKQSYNKEMEK